MKPRLLTNIVTLYESQCMTMYVPFPSFSPENRQPHLHLELKKIKGSFTYITNKTVFCTIKQWVCCSPMVLVSWNFRKIKGVTHSNGDINGTCKQALNISCSTKSDFCFNSRPNKEYNSIIYFKTKTGYKIILH